jgi:2-polyprenyl-3-methyl-5-hydroxy-6-metoxy-1,4-benzoquinol methylase
MITAEQERQLAELWATSVGHYMHKFAMTPRAWYAEAMQIARTAGLHESPPLKILDIGMGFGYFLKACRQLGHTIMGLDEPEKIIWQAATILDVPYVLDHVEAFWAMPAELIDYDLITTFGVNFRHDSGKYWGRDHYQWFSTDIRKRLRPGGRWLLRPNQTDDPDSLIASLMDPAWWREVAGPQATVTISTHEVEIQWDKN